MINSENICSCCFLMKLICSDKSVVTIAGVHLVSGIHLVGISTLFHLKLIFTEVRASCKKYSFFETQLFWNEETYTSTRVHKKMQSNTENTANYESSGHQNKELRAEYEVDVSILVSVWIDWLMGPIYGGPHLRTKFIVGTILIWFLVFHVCALGCVWDGSGLCPFLWVQEKFV